MDLHPEFWERPKLAQFQEQRLGGLLDMVLEANPFWQRKFQEAGLERKDISNLGDFFRLPFTTKAELLADQEAHPPYGSNLTYSLREYCRLCQTSGTLGNPLRWLDDAASWENMLGCWTRIFNIVGVDKTDRLFFPFSFGPFLGFWTAFESALKMGSLCIPAGGMSSGARLRMLLDNRITVILTTPTYALRLAEVAREQGIALEKSTPGYAVRAIIVAGEPGGSIQATRARIEQAWQARLFDHSGMTEVGPTAVECLPNPGGLHILETEYLAEVIDPSTGQSTPPGQVGELVLTTLVRTGSPLLRYRTGDLVRVDPKPCPCGRTFLRLEGGILGRTDDMIQIRGTNFYPAALEDVIRRFPEVAEYRVQIDTASTLPQVRVEIEPFTSETKDTAERVSLALRDKLLFRVEVQAVAPGSLPRFEMKARRIIRK